MKRLSPTFVEINLQALRFNYRQLKKRLPKGMQTLCVVKSNAYGHGAPEVARALEDEGSDWFGVGTIDEGMALRAAGIKNPILILLGLFPEPMGSAFKQLLQAQLTPVVYDLTTAAQLEAWLCHQKRRLAIHVKVDTGMTRLGVLPEDLESFLVKIKSFPHLESTGMLSHLADAGEDVYTSRQMRAFEKACQIFRSHFEGTCLFHLANSQAVIGGTMMRGMARFGIALYGAYPLERDKKQISLKPVLSWKTRIVSLKAVKKGTSVSYGRKFRARRKSLIAVIPVGYADGYPRNLSNRFHVLVRGQRVPIAGTICMDMMMLDVTGVSGVRIGDEVTLIGRQGDKEIQVEDMAKEANTISYEIFCRISTRLTRTIR